MMLNSQRSQYMTPSWAAELIVRHFYPDLNSNHIVFEPTAGDGRFLMAIPDHVPAIGMEIDPDLATTAIRNSGRHVICGDILTTPLPCRPTHIIGNPPYKAEVVNGLLAVAYEAMDYGGQVGLLLPTSTTQTASRVVALSEKWSLKQTLIPRNIFKNLESPLYWLQFVKEKKTSSVGFFLYHETDSVMKICPEYKPLFIGNESRASLWGSVIERALRALGGHASLTEIYAEIEGRRPTKNRFWKAQIRKVLQRDFVRLGTGHYSLPGLSSKHEIAA